MKNITTTKDTYFRWKIVELGEPIGVVVAYSHYPFYTYDEAAKDLRDYIKGDNFIRTRGVKYSFDIYEI